MPKPLYLLPNNTKPAHPGGGGKRSYEQREHDLMIVADLYLRKKTIKEIQAIINAQYEEEGITLSFSAIYDDIQEIHKRWINSALLDFNEAKGKELAEWDNLEKTYWEAWERSLQAKTVEERQTIYDQIAFAYDQVADVKRTKERRRLEESYGMVVFLQGVERCIDARCKILGLYSPDKLQVDWRVEAKKAGIDEKLAGEEFEKMVEGFVKAIEKKSMEGGEGS